MVTPHKVSILTSFILLFAFTDQVKASKDVKPDLSFINQDEPRDPIERAALLSKAELWAREFHARISKLEAENFKFPDYSNVSVVGRPDLDDRVCDVHGIAIHIQRIIDTLRESKCSESEEMRIQRILSKVDVAPMDKRIYDAVRSFYGRKVLTPAKRSSTKIKRFLYGESQILEGVDSQNVKDTYENLRNQNPKKEPNRGDGSANSPIPASSESR